VGLFPSKSEQELQSELCSLASGFYSEVRGSGPEGYGEALVAMKRERISQLRDLVLKEKGKKGLTKAHSAAMNLLWKLIRGESTVVDMRDGSPGDRFYKAVGQELDGLLGI
jgi:hypothetical protein